MTSHYEYNVHTLSGRLLGLAVALLVIRALGVDALRLPIDGTTVTTCIYLTLLFVTYYIGLERGHRAARRGEL